MTLRSQTVTLEKIATGYVVKVTKGDWGSTETSAFVNWNDAIAFAKDNTPSMIKVTYKDGEDFVEVVN